MISSYVGDDISPISKEFITGPYYRTIVIHGTADEETWLKSDNGLVACTNSLSLNGVIGLEVVSEHSNPAHSVIASSDILDAKCGVGTPFG